LLLRHLVDPSRRRLGQLIERGLQYVLEKIGKAKRKERGEWPARWTEETVSYRESKIVIWVMVRVRHGVAHVHEDLEPLLEALGGAEWSVRVAHPPVE